MSSRLSLVHVLAGGVCRGHLWLSGPERAAMVQHFVTIGFELRSVATSFAAFGDAEQLSEQELSNVQVLGTTGASSVLKAACGEEVSTTSVHTLGVCGPAGAGPATCIATLVAEEAMTNSTATAVPEGSFGEELLAAPETSGIFSGSLVRHLFFLAKAAYNHGPYVQEGTVDCVEICRSNKNIRVIGRVAKDCVELAFRGTVIATDAGEFALENWCGNFNTHPVPLQYGLLHGRDVLVHGGFQLAYLEVRQQILKWLEKSTSSKGVLQAIISGHSLGGALAILCAMDLCALPQGVDLRVATWGSPPLGSTAFRELFAREGIRIAQFVNKCDPVPRLAQIAFALPLQDTKAMRQYMHVSDPVPLDSFVTGCSDALNIELSHELDIYYRNLENCFRDQFQVSISQGYRLTSSRAVSALLPMVSTVPIVGGLATWSKMNKPEQKLQSVSEQNRLRLESQIVLFKFEMRESIGSISDNVRRLLDDQVVEELLAHLHVIAHNLEDLGDVACFGGWSFKLQVLIQRLFHTIRQRMSEAQDFEHDLQARFEVVIRACRLLLVAYQSTGKEFEQVKLCQALCKSFAEIIRGGGGECDFPVLPLRTLLNDMAASPDKSMLLVLLDETAHCKSQRPLQAKRDSNERAFRGRIAQMRHKHGAEFMTKLFAVQPQIEALIVFGRKCYANVAAHATPIWYWTEPTKAGECWWTPYNPDSLPVVFTSDSDPPSGYALPCSQRTVRHGFWAGQNPVAENQEIMLVLASITDNLEAFSSSSCRSVICSISTNNVERMSHVVRGASRCLVVGSASNVSVLKRKFLPTNVDRRSVSSCPVSSF